MDYDIAIIGGGPAGYNAAERAAENGLTTVLFEKQAIGGVCLHQGCTPSFDLPKIIKHKGKSVKLLTSGVRMKLAAIEGAERDVIHITCNNEQYDVNYLLLCTGSDIVIPSVKGLSEVYYWTSKEILENKVIGCHIVGNSASELIVVVGIAIERKFTEDEFQRVVFPHPTVGETVYESQFL